MQAIMHMDDGKRMRIYASRHQTGEGGWIEIEGITDNDCVVIHAQNLTVLENIGNAILDKVAKLREKQCANTSKPTSAPSVLAQVPSETE